VLPIRTKPFLINLGEEIKLLSVLVHSFEAHTKKNLSSRDYIYELRHKRWVKPGENSKAKTLLLQASTSTREQKKQLILMKRRKISLVEKALGVQ
jgi:hypothetical protein